MLCWVTELFLMLCLSMSEVWKHAVAAHVPAAESQALAGIRHCPGEPRNTWNTHSRTGTWPEMTVIIKQNSWYRQKTVCMGSSQTPKVKWAQIKRMKKTIASWFERYIWLSDSIIVSLRLKQYYRIKSVCLAQSFLPDMFYSAMPHNVNKE